MICPQSSPNPKFISCQKTYFSFSLFCLFLKVILPSLLLLLWSLLLLLVLWSLFVLAISSKGLLFLEGSSPLKSPTTSSLPLWPVATKLKVPSDCRTTLSGIWSPCYKTLLRTEFTEFCHSMLLTSVFFRSYGNMSVITAICQ